MIPDERRSPKKMDADTEFFDLIAWAVQWNVRHQPKDWVRVDVDAGSADWVTARSAQTPGRNDPCSCGSGRKWKVCCLRNN